MVLLKKFHTCGEYRSNHWDYEDTYKYIISTDQQLLEAGCFIHYLGKKYVKHVIELPTSYGCPMKCKYCASSAIDKISPLQSNTIYGIFKMIYDENTFATNHIVVSFLGIGDLYYTIDNVLQSIQMINTDNPSIVYNLSSCCWTANMIEKVKSSTQIMNIKTLQITFLSNNRYKLEQLIPGIKNIDYSFHDLVKEIQNNELINWKINYLMLKDINDSSENFYEFVDLVKPIRDKIVVRISKLNQTNASLKNNISMAELAKLTEFVQLLKENLIRSYIFYSYNDDCMNCGQLITEKNETVLNN